MVEEIKRPDEAENLKQAADKLQGYENYYPRWISEYVEGGNTIFSEYELGVFRQTAIKYDDEYIPALELFVGELEKSDSKNAGNIIKGINSVIAMMKNVVDYIEVIVADNTSNVVSQEDIGRLFMSMSMIEQQTIEYHNLAMRDKQTREAAEAVKDSTKVELQKISRTSKLASQMFKKAVPKKGLLARAKEITPGGYDLGKSLLGGVAAATLGPFGELGRLAVEAGTGAIGRYRQAKVSAGRRTFAKEITGGVPYIPEETFEETEVQRQGGTGLSLYGLSGGKPTYRREGNRFVKDIGGGENIYERGRGMAIRRAQPQAIQPVMQRSDVSVGSAKMTGKSLFNFFDKEAYNAKWTKEMLSLFRRMNKGIGEVDGGGGLVETAIGSALGIGAGAGLLGRMKGLLGKGVSKAGMAVKGAGGAVARGGAGLVAKGGTALKGVAAVASKAALPAAAITAAAAGGWMAGRAIGGMKVGGKTIDKRVEEFAVKNIFGDEKKKLKKAAKKDTGNSVVSRALELQALNPELTTKEAVTMVTQQDKSKGLSKPAVEEKKTTDAIDIKSKELNLSEVQASIMQDKDVKNAIGGLKEIQKIKEERIEPVIQNDILPAMNNMTAKLEATMKEVAKSVSSMAKEAGSTIVKKQRAGSGNAHSTGDDSIEFLNLGIIGLGT
jgi:hypothetical protein